MPPNTQGNQGVPLLRLQEGSDVGMVGVGLIAKIVESPSEFGGQPEKRVQVWLTVALAKPSRIDGVGAVIEEIPWRLVDSMTPQSLIDKFEELQAGKVKPSLISL